MQVRVTEKNLKTLCTLLPHLFLGGNERYGGPPKYNVGAHGLRGPSTSYATYLRYHCQWSSMAACNWNCNFNR